MKIGLGTKVELRRYDLRGNLWHNTWDGMEEDLMDSLWVAMEENLWDSLWESLLDSLRESLVDIPESGR